MVLSKKRKFRCCLQFRWKNNSFGFLN